MHGRGCERCFPGSPKLLKIAKITKKNLFLADQSLTGGGNNNSNSNYSNTAVNIY